MTDKVARFDQASIDWRIETREIVAWFDQYFNRRTS